MVDDIENMERYTAIEKNITTVVKSLQLFYSYKIYYIYIIYMSIKDNR